MLFFLYLTHSAGLPVASTCAFRSAQPKVSQNVAAVPSFANTEILRMIHGVKSRSVLQLIFDCRDHADNNVKLSSSLSTSVSSFLLTAPRFPSSAVWCCNEKDQVASVSQDISDSFFTASASFVTPGNNFIVPAIISAGTYYLNLSLGMAVLSI
jgi:hypothetical protein